MFRCLNIYHVLTDNKSKFQKSLEIDISTAESKYQHYEQSILKHVSRHPNHFLPKLKTRVTKFNISS